MLFFLEKNFLRYSFSPLKSLKRLIYSFTFLPTFKCKFQDTQVSILTYCCKTTFANKLASASSPHCCPQVDKFTSY